MYTKPGRTRAPNSELSNPTDAPLRHPSSSTAPVVEKSSENRPDWKSKRVSRNYGLELIGLSGACRDFVRRITVRSFISHQNIWFKRVPTVFSTLHQIVQIVKISNQIIQFEKTLFMLIIEHYHEKRCLTLSRPFFSLVGIGERHLRKTPHRELFHRKPFHRKLCTGSLPHNRRAHHEQNVVR